MASAFKRILLIDDSNFSRKMLKRALGDQYQFLEADNGLAGIELYANEKPDLVILDLTMPEMNGMDVIAILRERDPQARIIIGSADVQSFTRQQVTEMGAVGFILKPFNPEVVKATVQEIFKA